MNLLTVWGDPTTRSSYTIDLYPVDCHPSQPVVRQVLVFARDYREAVEIARREALWLKLEPRSEGRERLN